MCLFLGFTQWSEHRCHIFKPTTIVPELKDLYVWGLVAGCSPTFRDPTESRSDHQVAWQGAPHRWQDLAPPSFCVYTDLKCLTTITCLRVVAGSLHSAAPQKAEVGGKERNPLLPFSLWCPLWRSSGDGRVSVYVNKPHCSLCLMGPGGVLFPVYPCSLLLRSVLYSYSLLLAQRNFLQGAVFFPGNPAREQSLWILCSIVSEWGSLPLLFQ